MISIKSTRSGVCRVYFSEDTLKAIGSHELSMSFSKEDIYLSLVTVDTKDYFKVNETTRTAQFIFGEPQTITGFYKLGAETSSGWPLIKIDDSVSLDH